MALTADQEKVLGALADFILAVQRGGASGVSDVPRVATDADLDGPKGDPKAKMDPKDYIAAGGTSFKGCPLSICSPEFLDAYAEVLQYFAEHPKPDKVQFARYDAMDAARARGWANRLRAKAPSPNGSTANSGPTGASEASFRDDDIPF